MHLVIGVRSNLLNLQGNQPPARLYVFRLDTVLELLTLPLEPSVCVCVHVYAHEYQKAFIPVQLLPQGLCAIRNVLSQLAP